MIFAPKDQFLHRLRIEFCRANAVEQEMLEREVQRLKMLLCQQQHCYDQQQASATTSRVLSSKFAALTLKHGQGSSNRDSLSGPLSI